MNEDEIDQILDQIFTLDLQDLKQKIPNWFAKGNIRKSVAIVEAFRAIEDTDQDLARSLNNLAQVHHDQGRYDEAKPLYVQALEIRRKALGEDHPDFAASLTNMGVLYVEQGRLDEAAPMLQQALVIFEKALPSDHAQTQTVRSWLDHLYAERPDLRDGAEMS